MVLCLFVNSEMLADISNSFIQPTSAKGTQTYCVCSKHRLLCVTVPELYMSQVSFLVDWLLFIV